MSPPKPSHTKGGDGGDSGDTRFRVHAREVLPGSSCCPGSVGYRSLGRNESPAGLTVLAHLPLHSSLAPLENREAASINTWNDYDPRVLIRVYYDRSVVTAGTISVDR